MTLAVENPDTRSVAAGGTTYALGWSCANADEVVVTVTDAAGDVLTDGVLQDRGVAYDLSGALLSGGANVIFRAGFAPAAGKIVRRYRSTPAEQPDTFGNAATFDPSDVERSLDRVWRGLQELKARGGSGASGGSVAWSDITEKPTFGSLARVGQNIKVVDDWISAAGQAPGVDDNTVPINACMATAQPGDKFIFPSRLYKLTDKIAAPNKDAVTLTSWGESTIWQTGDNRPGFEMLCAAVVGNFEFSGFRFRWASNADVTYDVGAGHLVGDTDAIGISFKASGADGNGEYNWRAHNLVFENGFRGISPNYDNTILGGLDFPLWGMDCQNIYAYQDMKGACLTLGNWGSGGGPRYTVADVYDNAANPVEASIQWNKTSGINFGALEFNNTVNMARLNGISGRGIVFSTVRFEHMTLATRDTALIIFSSPDSGRAYIAQLEFRSTDVTVAAGAGDGNVYGVRCYAGAECEIGNLTVQDTTGNIDKFCHYDPRIDDLADVDEGDPIPPGRPYPPGRIYALGGQFVDRGEDGLTRNGRTHDSIYAGPYIRFGDEEVFSFATAAPIADTAYYAMDTGVPGFSEYLMDRRGWVNQVKLEVVGGPVTGGYVRFRLVKNGAPIEWVSYLFGDPGVYTGADNSLSKLTRYISYGRYNDAIYGGGGDNQEDVWFDPDDVLAIEYKAEFTTVPAIGDLKLRASLRTASR